MSAPPLLSEEALRAALAELPDWSQKEGRLVWARRFGDFSAAFAFMTRVALLAEQQAHHPDWRNVYDRVEIELWTHDAGGLTERDLRLARAISALA